MRFRHGFLGLMAFGLAVGQLSAQSLERASFLFRRPATCDSCASPASGPVTVVPVDPQGPMDQPPQVVDPQAFAQAPAAGGEAGLSFNPAMFGDLGASGKASVLSSSSSNSSSHSSSSSSSSSNMPSGVLVPIVAHGSFKISDNESPRPTDRIFLTYNYFNSVNTVGSSFNLHREVIGFEKTFLDGDASFGMRLPFLQATGLGNSGFPDHEVGELTLIAKYAFINNTETGNVLAGGLVLTLPTADHKFTPSDGHDLNSVLFQPYVGWILNSGNLYAHAFHSLVVPTDSRDITVFDNDVGVGVWAYRDDENFLRGVVPTLEGHLYTPLNHRAITDVINASNIFTLTAGVNFVMPGNSSLGAGVATPLTGPKPNNMEAILSFNFRF